MATFLFFRKICTALNEEARKEFVMNDILYYMNLYFAENFESVVKLDFKVGLIAGVIATILKLNGHTILSGICLAVTLLQIVNIVYFCININRHEEYLIDTKDEEE